MRTHYRAPGYRLRRRDAKYFVREWGYHYSPASSLVPALLEEVERVMAMPSQGFVEWAIPWAYVRALPPAFVPVVAVELAKISKELPDEILVARARGHAKPTDARSQARLFKACLDLVAFDFQKRQPGSREASRRVWMADQLVMNAGDWILFWALATYLPWGVGKHA